MQSDSQLPEQPDSDSQFSDEERSVLISIATASHHFNGDKRPTPCAWLPVTQLEPDALALCVAKGLVTRWEADRNGNPIADGPQAVLTPYGAYLSRVVISERWRFHAEYRDGPRPSKRKIRVQVAEENPYHRTATPDKHGSLPIYWRRIKLPRRALEEELPCPDMVPDPLPGPEYMVDESDEPVTMFVKDDEPGRDMIVNGKKMKIRGIPVVIDKRLGRDPGAKKRATVRQAKR